MVSPRAICSSTTPNTATPSTPTCWPRWRSCPASRRPSVSTVLGTTFLGTKTTSQIRSAKSPPSAAPATSPSSCVPATPGKFASTQTASAREHSGGQRSPANSLAQKEPVQTYRLFFSPDDAPSSPLFLTLFASPTRQITYHFGRSDAALIFF